ncbi:phytanoyl-CoA dioxygenase family protein [Horticoccus luteus]|uniref:Phytanoyl-CoA dioxygenase family protein n=1 Tax=Horticoccus luteus TaxID=2862869 RepID=A0A8F9TUB6_9BACT|nr:phytanoyl-CoA dioxygenase family protein [Horticoccus luteus]QYM78433.1 phytanoyl-CoA dioxygenase family protein [Horticoccus luteus]
MSIPLPLTPAQVKSFHDEGFLIAPNVFAPADLEPLRREMAVAIDRKACELQADGKLTKLHAELDFDHRLAAIYRDSKENGEAIMRHLEGLRGGGFHAPEMFDVIAHPRLLAAVSALLDTEEIIASSVYRIRPKLPNLGRGIVPWHQDSGYLAASCDQHLIITCWVPLVDATVENGCMQILPRTHKGRVAEHRTGGNAGFLVIEDQDLPADPRRAVTAACPRGGVVFMTNRTPHCSTPNYSDHIRWSVDLRYQSAEVPNNAGLWPELEELGDLATPGFDEKVTVACYPPEADFVVQSRQHPETVTRYEEYVRRREVYDKTPVPFSAYGRWPKEATVAK